MVKPPPPVAADADLHTVAHRFAATGESSLPVLDDTGRYLGTINAHDIMDALAAGEGSDVGMLVATVNPVAMDSSIGEVLRRLDHGDNAVPVTRDDGALIGWVRHRDILAALATTTSNATPRSAA